MHPKSQPAEVRGEVIPLHRGGSSDSELVARALAGETSAHAEIYRRHAPWIAGSARRLLRGEDEAYDVVQETFLIAFEQLDRLQDPEALRGWLGRIAVSRVHRRFRRWRFLVFLHGDPGARFEEQASPDATPEQRAELALLDRALAALPVALRTPWILRKVVGWSLPEVATACECSLATAKRRIADADAHVQTHVGVGQ
jgi:RNA polymerase sigma-70 factor (ECF subfamily)